VPNFTDVALKSGRTLTKYRQKCYFVGINFPESGISPYAILQNYAQGSESQVRTLMPNFAVVVLKMWAYPNISRNGNFGLICP